MKRRQSVELARLVLDGIEFRQQEAGAVAVARSDDERLDTDHWNKIHAQWMDVFVRAAKQLTARLNKLKPATNDFGFYLFDEDNEIELLRRCMSAAKFKRLFPRLLAIVKS